MCRVDFDGYDLPKLQFSESRKAKREHICGECGRTILSDETYRIDKSFDISWHQNKTCAHCEVGRIWLARECNGWYYGQVGAEIMEHAEEYPEVAFSLYRFCVGHKHKWMRFDASAMMPVPAELPSPKYV